MEETRHYRAQRRSSQDDYISECHRQDEKLRSYTFPVYLETHRKWKPVASDECAPSPKTQYTRLGVSSAAAEEKDKRATACTGGGLFADEFSTKPETSGNWCTHRNTALDIVSRRPSLGQLRHNSLFSMVSFSSRSEESSPTARKPHHRRSSAVSMEKNVAWRLSLQFGEGHVGSKKAYTQDNRSSTSHDLQSPLALMAHTSEQLRRNSDCNFKAEAQLWTRGIRKSNSVYAGFPETGDQVPKTIELDLSRHLTSSEYSPTSVVARAKPEHECWLLPPLQFSDLSSPEEEDTPSSTENECLAGRNDDSELLSLKDFLISS
ncbi:LADA_0D05380g1_1 [Lachancea dasiensis]|uniref:LADA_0D05380g1_1 n=1 Tax=Lachancea dasiensis TaxID=1072105 RepID=A0A1G4J5F1_9SACH|nr:LADA_0D05380g1_1 [Lachancea dasiensis]